MRERLIANYTTTAMGIILILGSMVAVFTKLSTAAEVSGWTALGLTFLRSKDSLIGIPKN